MGDLKATLDKLGIPHREQKELQARRSLKPPTVISLPFEYLRAASPGCWSSQGQGTAD